MAANDCSNLKYFSATETAFYFEVAGKDLEEDAFDESVLPICQHLIRSYNNKFLILNDEEQFEAQNLTTAQQRQPDYKFNIKIYNDSTKGKGKAVMLYVNKDGKKMVACCNDKHEICPESMDLPERIKGNAHKAVFYLTKLPTSKYLLESSLYPTKFLGFEPDGDNHSLSKLVLHQREKKEVVDSCEVVLM